MKVKDISEKTLQSVLNNHWDNGIERHETSSWAFLLDPPEAEFFNVNGYDVLLPISKNHHPNISILRCIVSDDKQSLTIFLKDTTYTSDTFAGFVAVCDKVPGEEWFIAILYHDWHIIDNEHAIDIMK